MYRGILHKCILIGLEGLSLVILSIASAVCFDV